MPHVRPRKPSDLKPTWTERHAKLRREDAQGLDLMLELWREEALDLQARRRAEAKARALGPAA